MTRRKKIKKILSIILSIAVFVIAFYLLINKKDNENLGDVKNSDFNIMPLEAERIVLEDIGSIYPRYFVIYFDKTDNSYIVHSFNYYNTLSQYELEFNRIKEKIVDYNIDDYYIRYIYDLGNMEYNDILNNLEIITDTRNFKIYD